MLGFPIPLILEINFWGNSFHQIHVYFTIIHAYHKEIVTQFYTDKNR